MTDLPTHILIVEDEADIRRFVRLTLESDGHTVHEAATLQRGLIEAGTRRPDLVVLDLGLPDQDGQDVLKELRQWSRVPVIVLTVRASEDQKVALLDAGANDYVTKPFGIEELMARIRVLLRHARRDEALAPVYDDGVLRIDLARHEVHLHGQPLALTRKEFTLLSLLARQPGRLVTQPQLLREMWGPTHQEDAHYLRVLVGKLRAKLGDDAAAPLYIATEPGVGLRFLGREKTLPPGEP